MVATGLSTTSGPYLPRVRLNDLLAASFRAAHSSNVKIGIPYVVPSPDDSCEDGSEDWSSGREESVIELPTELSYPILAIGDLHGQRLELERLIRKLETLPGWSDCALVFLGDFVDRGPNVRGTIELVRELLRRLPGGSAIMGNHDLALVRAARLDGGPPSSYWVESYRTRYDCHATFESYLGRAAMTWGGAWQKDLDALREAMPAEHKRFLATLRWVVEAPGHVFVHCGLTPELSAGPEAQVEALRARRWDRKRLRPIPGTNTDTLWEDDYPVWLGADKGLSASPLPYPGKVQVSGHVRVRRPDVNEVRIRLDTSGGCGPLTACLLRSAGAEPMFVPSR
jgi:serine/threonine protein phosphatase 1